MVLTALTYVIIIVALYCLYSYLFIWDEGDRFKINKIGSGDFIALFIMRTFITSMCAFLVWLLSAGICFVIQDVSCSYNFDKVVKHDIRSLDDNNEQFTIAQEGDFFYFKDKNSNLFVVETKTNKNNEVIFSLEDSEKPYMEIMYGVKKSEITPYNGNITKVKVYLPKNTMTKRVADECNIQNSN